MKCPHCDHDSSLPLASCPECGKALQQGRLETLRHLEYLLGWLQEREENIGPQTHARLCGEVQGQLDDLRRELGLVAVERPPEQLGPELALVEGAAKLVEQWCQEGGVDPVPAWSLARFLAAQAEELRRELAGRPPEVEPPSDEELHAVVAEGTDYYNNRQRHSTIGYQAPVMYIAGLQPWARYDNPERSNASKK